MTQSPCGEAEGEKLRVLCAFVVDVFGDNLHDEISQTRAHVVHQHHESNQNQHNRRRFLILERAKARIHQVADPAGAD